MALAQPCRSVSNPRLAVTDAKPRWESSPWRRRRGHKRDSIQTWLVATWGEELRDWKLDRGEGVAVQAYQNRSRKTDIRRVTRDSHN